MYLHVYLLIPFEERASPWPKFDKAVSELHDWLDTLSDMMKTEKIVLGDSEDMEGLLEKQKVRTIHWSNILFVMPREVNFV